MRSAEQEIFHIGNGVEIEDRFRRRILILYGKIKKVECQKINYSETQDIALVMACKMCRFVA